MSENPGPFSFIAGALCLDFVNTVSSHGSERPREKLGTFADLIRWSREADLLDEEGARDLLSGSSEDSPQRSKILEDARKLRQVLFRIFGAVGQRKSPSADVLAAFNETLRSFPVQLEVRIEDENFCCERKIRQTDASRLLAPVVWSAADLLGSDHIHRVRQCADKECGWFFVDNTKNRSRRWCAMSDCGSHAKAKRYYQRKKRVVHERAETSSRVTAEKSM
jgi:predicted RNA-binding Zn ribbon-like protein